MCLEGFSEQHFPGYCPNCNAEIGIEHWIGIGSYPKNGYRAALHPGRTEGMGMECPRCFEKSTCHLSEEWQKIYDRKLKLEEK